MTFTMLGENNKQERKKNRAQKQSIISSRTEYCLNPMQRDLQNLPQDRIAWDLHSQWMQTIQNNFTIILWEQSKL